MFVVYSKDRGTSWSDKKLGKSQVVVPTIINVGTMEMIACLWIILAFSTMAFSQTNFYTHGRYGKREETHASDALPSFSGSRYGRGGVTSIGISSSTNEKSLDKTLQILPRVDRFFLGSRYGKRGSINNNSVDNDEQAMFNIQSLKAVLSFIYRVRHDNNQRLMIGNKWNNEKQIQNEKGKQNSEEVNGDYISQEKLKSNNKWHWF